MTDSRRDAIQIRAEKRAKELEIELFTNPRTWNISYPEPM
jgi:hypothetical protein